MSLTKRLLRFEPSLAVLAWLAALYIRLVYLTTRWRVVCPRATETLQAEARPFIACFWHGRMLMMRAALPREKAVHMLISEHRDGMLISRAIADLGVLTVPGSSKRGGLSALRAMQRLLADGASVGITPDGPRGPRMRAKAGAIKTAQLSGAPIVPISGAVSRRRILDSWDRFCVALPFSYGVIFWGEPIEVPRDADAAELERLRSLLEERLNALTAAADRTFGQRVIEPEATESRRAPAPAADQAGHARA
ncbi:MAG: lysophospholipid acyltransferase family protein [Kiloniellaceae bacterium]